MALQTAAAADVHPVQGQLLHEEQALGNVKSLIFLAGTGRPTVSKMERQT
jgi:hypothetical protein